MKSNGWRVAALLVAVVAVLGSTGCPGTNILPNGNGTILFELVLVGQPIASYDCVLFEWDQLNILPLDGKCGPGADEGEPCYRDDDCASFSCLGSAAMPILGDSGYPIQMGLLGTLGQQGNLSGGDCVPTTNPPINVSQAEAFQPIGVVLPAGLYKMDRIRVGNVVLYIDTPDPIVKRCTQIKTVTDEFPENVTTFALASGETRTIRMELDAGMLEGLVDGEFPANSANCNDFFDDHQNWVDFLQTVLLSVS